jgi:hypothetical protein
MICVCVCVCVKVSLSSIHQNDQDLFDDQVQPFCVSRILQNKMKHANKQQSTQNL